MSEMHYSTQLDHIESEFTQSMTLSTYAYKGSIKKTRVFFTKEFGMMAIFGTIVLVNNERSFDKTL